MILLEYLISFICVIIAIVAHEMSHAYMSYFLGDPTPKETGRLSLNPLKHIDPIGFVCMLFFRVGWARPVRINSEYYKNRRLGMFLVAFAGPLMNFILALLGTIVYAIIVKINVNVLLNENLVYIFNYFILINMGLGMFNLIPIPPLDGSRIVGSFLTANAYNGYMKAERYGFIIVIGILFLDEIITGIFGITPLFDTVLDFLASGMITTIFKLFQII